MSVFYSMSLLILTLRFTMVVNYYRFDRRTIRSGVVGPSSEYLLGDECDIAATYFKLCLGFMQVASML